MTRARLWHQNVLLTVLLGLSLLTAASSKAQDTTRMNVRMNVLFVVFDDLNMDIGAYGHPDALTPAIDEFAKQSVRFDQAHCNGTFCAPSRASFLSGLYPSTTGAYGGERLYEIEKAKNVRSLFAHFLQHDYRVWGTGKLFHGNWDPDIINAQFDEYFIASRDAAPKAYYNGEAKRHPGNPRIREKDASNGSWGPLSAVPDAKTYGPGWEGWGPFRYVSEDDRDLVPDEQYTQWAIERLRRAKGENPFFMSVGYMKPHTPLYAPKKFFDMYDPRNLTMRPVLQDDLDDVVPVMRQTSMYSDMWDRISAYPNAEAIWRDYYRAYLACTSFADAEFGKLMTALKQSGHADNTIVIVTSDHGYHFGDKNRIGKGSPWQGTTRVPMLVRIPGMTQDGAICKQTVSLVDLYPTLIDLCGLSDKPHGPNLPLDGHSLLPLLADVDARWQGPSVALNYCYSKAWTVSDAEYRYVLDPDGNEELYDLVRDPNEWRNVVGQPEYARVRNQLRGKLLELSGGKRPFHQ